MDDLDLMSASDIANLLGVQQSAITNARTRGAFIEPVGKVGGRFVWRRSDVEAWARRTGRRHGAEGRIYDAEGYDVTTEYVPKIGA